jgi:hypothetical protein
MYRYDEFDDAYVRARVGRLPRPGGSAVSTAR